MQIQACTYDDCSAGQATAALVVLQSDEVMEQELRAWLPTDLRLLHTRIPNDGHITADALTAMAKDLPAAVALLPAAIDYSVVAYGCTSASTLIGEDRVRDLIQSVIPGVAVTNPLTALKASLEALDVRRIGLLTPYKPAISTALLNHLEDCGIEVVKAVTFNEPDDDRVARISASSVMDAMLQLGQHEQCDAVFGACTNLRSFGFLEQAQQSLGKPVLTSNSVLAWHVRELAAKP